MISRAAIVGSFAFVGGAAWAAIAYPLSSVHAGKTGLLSAAGYAFVWGGLEIVGAPVRPPGLHWQVPASWVRNKPRSTRILVWAAMLGPGLATRNPLAGMWLLPIMLMSLPSRPVVMLVGACAGAAHGFARGWTVTRQTLCGDGSPRQTRAVLAEMHWGVIDGMLLLLVAGLVIGAIS